MKKYLTPEQMIPKQGDLITIQVPIGSLILTPDVSKTENTSIFSKWLNQNYETDNGFLDDLKSRVEKHLEWLDTEDGQKSINNWFEENTKKEKHLERWTQKIKMFLENKTDEELEVLFSKLDKHKEKRRDILFNQGYDSESDLLSPLYTVFTILGEEKNSDGMFSDSVFIWRGYKMEIICGQGCFTLIKKL